MTKEQNLVLISLVIQLLEKTKDISDFNPFVQEYISGLVEEVKEMESEEKDMVYFYADTFFNKLNGNKRSLN